MNSPNAKERTGYPTQKPLALLERIIKASSNEGDVVLDPFCGCATAMVAAHRLNRNWIGIDVSEKASELLQSRLSTEQGLFKNYIHVENVPDARRNVRRMKPKDAKDELYGICKGNCRCGTHFEFRNLEVDHIIPKAKGGGDYFENYELLCSSCNKIKGDRPMQYLDNIIEKIRANQAKVRYDSSF